MIDSDPGSLDPDTAVSVGGPAAPCCSITEFTRALGSRSGLSIRSLPLGTTLIVQTRNTRYRVILLEGQRDAVLVLGGRWFPSAAEARLQGASLGGAFLKVAHIVVGLCLELVVRRERIVTSPVRSVTVERWPATLATGPH
jgi:hypothetical protein